VAQKMSSIKRTVEPIVGSTSTSVRGQMLSLADLPIGVGNRLGGDSVTCR
jgi:hypothetical protein